MAKNKHCGHI